MDHYQKYLESAVTFLSYRPRSIKEVRENLLKKNAPPEIIEKIVIFLTEQRFLNDEEFARWWIEQRNTYRPKGKRVIQMELVQKGIAPEIITTILEEKKEEGEDDLSSAKKIVEKKIGKYKDLPIQELYQKLGGVLARRGFGWEVIKRSIDEILRDGV